ncbi:division/cell wall cluster transcriptional repressor MraZ [Rhodobacter sp. Har01]|uniref:division/cell wall cluster transcriptional repressor MraZ n=1 Tax=Rhodobacter sp. Har01 TaxID=2883999 RepID=UPI001D08EFB5|nr:division/cell wall cluster transcriptional repressor MraZ [Rhodobacter sp. Har01]MCB6178620.1 division/cell wall cluster transcriptional repressor MraZ [Rhodobacter sp. Har01]
MAEAFRGEFYQKVDAKARVSIPAAFRRILDADDKPRADKEQPHVYLVYGGRNRSFVEGYSKRGADDLADQIAAMELGSKARMRAERELISRSIMVELEPDGRIVLPPKVREKIGLTDGDLGSAEAAFAGVTNRFRLYSRKVYDAELAADADDEDEDVDPLALVGRSARGG